MEVRGDYRSVLSEKFQDRRIANPSYSLRAYARDLGLSPSRLSQILNRKLGLSETAASQVATKLGMAPDQHRIFCTQVTASDSRSKSKRRVAALELASSESLNDPTHVLEQEAFRVISSWYHYAILELTTLKGFKSNPTWVAAKLGISVAEVESAVKRLRLLDLLSDKDGKWVQTHANLVTRNGVPSDALKKFHSQVLQKAAQSIHEQTPAERNITSLTLAINTDELPDLVERIRKFRRGFNEHVETSPEHSSPDAVYSLGIQLFRLTKKEDV